jgi:hypothetical protein
MNIVEYLTGKGAELDVQNEDGETPLFQGKLHGRIKIYCFIFHCFSMFF